MPPPLISAVGLGQFTDKTRVDWALDTNSMFDVDANLDSAARYFLACKESRTERTYRAQEDAMIYKVLSRWIVFRQDRFRRFNKLL